MKKMVYLLLIISMLYIIPASACTTTIVGKDATTDGSVIVSHSDDDELGDQRIVYVPAKDHPPGSMRPVYYDIVSFGNTTNRYVGASRGPAYLNPDLPQSKPIGYIPQVSHTYAYFDGNYGIMNEHQLMFGECTNGAKIELKPKKGERIFYSAGLSRVALERCRTARKAVALMGKLIDKYGYYGTGETLLVGDTQEAWVFEMCCSPDGKGGFWVAKKVPDNEMFAAANEFRIREITPDMLHTEKLFEKTKKAGWWDGKEPFDWLRVVSRGEYNHPYYSLRRVWSIFRRAKPSAKFSPWVKDGFTKAYPFSIKPDKKLSVRDVMAFHRDHYNGTEFDMTKGLAAGPFGSPDRYIGKYDLTDFPKAKLWGAWERPITVFYAGYSYINQARGWLPDPIGGISWFGPDKPYETCYIPFYAGVNDLPRSYQTGSTKKYDRKTAWWAFNFVNNWANLKYSYMIKDIRTKQKELEDKEFNNQPTIEKKALTLYEKDPKLTRAYLTKYSIDNADEVVGQWWLLANHLIEKYSDGYVNKPEVGREIGYPGKWLQKVGYDKGPSTYEKR
ncbi:MAG: C69 family dipeptidase [Candidatus Margulisiibacteriota bacterium]|nr:C69 family dipeptidase [Candidatus Margulisiibacteriota bacterium]